MLHSQSAGTALLQSWLDCHHVCVCVCVYTGIVQIGGESVCPVDASGNFTQEITDFAGQ